MMAIGEVEKMIAVGLVWGSTNALMRRGALIWDHHHKHQSSSSSSSSTTSNPNNITNTIAQKMVSALTNWIELLLIWQYSIPFLVNLSASATFFAILGGDTTPISLAVPVTNAVTFASTAIAAMLLGEETRVSFALLGAFLIVLGVYVCVV